MIDCRILLKNSTIYGLKIQQIRFKSHLVVLGAGWGGFRLATDVDKNKYDVTVLSPRNHFLFTPLLPSTSVGTLEFRCVQEPVRTIKGKRMDHLHVLCTVSIKRTGSLNYLEVFEPSCTCFSCNR